MRGGEGGGVNLLKRRKLNLGLGRGLRGKGDLLNERKLYVGLVETEETKFQVRNLVPLF